MEGNGFTNINFVPSNKQANGKCISKVAMNIVSLTCQA